VASTDIEIGSPTIRLGQLLKLGGLVGSGGEARAVLATGEVTVNGAVELRRGRQVRPGDVVALGATRVRVVDRAPRPVRPVAGTSQ
jgi:ribosome-associated protein